MPILLIIFWDIYIIYGQTFIIYFIILNKFLFNQSLKIYHDSTKKNLFKKCSKILVLTPAGQSDYLSEFLIRQLELISYDIWVYNM